MKDKLKLISACNLLIVEINGMYSSVNNTIPEGIESWDILRVADYYCELKSMLP